MQRLSHEKLNRQKLASAGLPESTYRRTLERAADLILAHDSAKKPKKPKKRRKARRRQVGVIATTEHFRVERAADGTLTTIGRNTPWW